MTQLGYVFGEAVFALSVGRFKMRDYAGKAARRSERTVRQCLFSAENFLWIYACACIVSILVGSTGECEPAEAWINEYSRASPLVGLFFVFRPGSGAVDVCMCRVPLFVVKDMVFMDDNHSGPAAQFAVLLE